MKKLSKDELIDLVALNRVLDKAETVVWAYEDGFHYISDNHIAVKIRMSNKNSTALRALFGRFHGELPKAGTALRSIRSLRDYVVDQIPMDGIKRIFETEAHLPIEDTNWMYELADYNRTARAFKVSNDKTSSYVFLNVMFLDCIYRNFIACAVSADQKSMVRFWRYDEVAVILPVVIDKPKYMVSPQVLDLN